ncbi:hypothetical protein T484DRAFT_1898864 [Baffinella frigidus]|nr:hypothetical protein T484DRAFT_1898864 [Cryptophyta sp. CCMP2293]
MVWIVFPRKTLTDTLLPAPAANPAPKVKAAVLEASPVAVQIPPLAARRSKKPPCLNIATFQTADSLAHGQFRALRHRPLAPAQQIPQQNIQSSQEEQNWAALVMEHADAMPARLAGWLEQLGDSRPRSHTAKAIAYTDAIQVRAKHNFYKDATRIIPGPIVPYRRPAARQSKSQGSKRTLR